MRNAAKRVVLFLGVAIGSCLLAGIAGAADNSEPPGKVVTTCQSCHGPRGDSVTATVPRLNGQRADYIQSRLNDFLDPTREDPHATATMGNVMSEIDDASFGPIAAYYAAQAPTQATSGAPHAGDGLKIFRSGAAAQNVPACQSCHGAKGEGSSAGPRLAGQHAIYLTKQLERLRVAMRESKSMYHDIKAMTDAQIQALVAYLARD